MTSSFSPATLGQEGCAATVWRTIPVRRTSECRTRVSKQPSQELVWIVTVFQTPCSNHSLTGTSRVFTYSEPGPYSFPNYQQMLVSHHSKRAWKAVTEFSPDSFSFARVSAHLSKCWHRSTRHVHENSRKIQSEIMLFLQEILRTKQFRIFQSIDVPSSVQRVCDDCFLKLPAEFLFLLKVLRLCNIEPSTPILISMSCGFQYFWTLTCNSDLSLATPSSFAALLCPSCSVCGRVQMMLLTGHDHVSDALSCFLAPTRSRLSIDAVMHMISKNDLNSAELETATTSRSPTTVITPDGEVQTNTEAM